MGALLTTAIILGLAIKNYLENRKYANYAQEPSVQSKPKRRCKSKAMPKPTHALKGAGEVLPKSKKASGCPSKGKSRREHLNNGNRGGNPNITIRKPPCCHDRGKSRDANGEKLKATKKRNLKSGSKRLTSKTRQQKRDYLAK